MLESKILRSSALIGVFYLISRLVGLFRDRVLGGTFGASSVLDAYYAAFSIPDFIFNLVIAGAITAAFIPIFIQEESKDSDSAWNMASVVMTTAFIAILFLSGLAFILMPLIIRGIAPGFDTETFNLAVRMSRWMLISPVLFSFSSVFGALLQSFNRFLFVSLAPVLYNLGIILGAIWLVPMYGPIGLAFGVILGALFHVLIHLFGLFSIKAKLSFKLDLKNTFLRRIIRLSIPRTLTLAVDQINLMLVAALASTVSVGALAVFNLANNFRYLPISLIGISFAVASFPTLSRLANENIDGFKTSIEKSLRGMLFIVIPATVILFQYADEIIRIVLETGLFSSSNIELTSLVLKVLCLGIIAESLVPFLARSFYALENTWTPAIAGGVGLITNIVLSLILINIYGVIGLAFAFSIAGIVKCIWLLVALNMRMESISIKSVIGLGIYSLIVSLCIYFVFSTFDLNINLIVKVLVFSGLQALIYLLISYILRVKEVRVLFKKA